MKSKSSRPKEARASVHYLRGPPPRQKNSNILRSPLSLKSIQALRLPRGHKILSCIATALIPSVQVAAQDGDENAMVGAGDAFGRQVGTEQIGIYSDNDVRGFDPTDAGNARVQGLYFDELSGLPNRLVEGSTIRVGLSAQGFAFPAPTGLVDYELKVPATCLSGAVRASLGPYSGRAIFGEVSVPLADDIGVLGGFEVRQREFMDGGNGLFGNFGALVAWRPSEETEITALFGQEFQRDNDTGPRLFVAGNFLPPRIQRGKDLGQPWTLKNEDSSIAGLVAKIPIGPYRLETSLFRSERTAERYSDTITGITTDGIATGRTVTADIGNSERVLSGEARLVREWSNSIADHRITLSYRSRDGLRFFGGGQRYDLGASTVIEPDMRPAPIIEMDDPSRDEVRQQMVGVAYSGAFFDALQIDIGVSKARYRKNVDFAAGPIVSTLSVDNPILWNFSGSISVSPNLRVYAGAASGLEDAPIAPDQAVNRSVAPPAIKTRQKDVAVSWNVGGGLTFIMGAFDITKPYYNLDATSRYRLLGDLSSRGIELSLAGEIYPGLSIVAGTILLDQSVTGEIIESGRIGSSPVGSTRRRSTLNFDWRLGRGAADWSFDAGISSSGRKVANAENTLFVPATFFLELGARYRFNAMGMQMIARPRVQNFFNGYTWRVTNSGGFLYNDRRRVSLELRATF